MSTSHEIDLLNAEIARLKDQVSTLEWKRGRASHRADLHANINRRVAEALGKPVSGDGSSWHDLPECVAALKAQVARLQSGLREEIADQELHSNKVLEALQEAAAQSERADRLQAEVADLTALAWHDRGDGIEVLYRDLAEAEKVLRETLQARLRALVEAAEPYTVGKSWLQARSHLQDHDIAQGMHLTMGEHRALARAVEEAK